MWADRLRTLDERVLGTPRPVAAATRAAAEPFDAGLRATYRASAAPLITNAALALTVFLIIVRVTWHLPWLWSIVISGIAAGIATVYIGTLCFTVEAVEGGYLRWSGFGHGGCRPLAELLRIRNTMTTGWQVIRFEFADGQSVRVATWFGLWRFIDAISAAYPSIETRVWFRDL